jgi:hypothetical protein
MRSSRLRVKPLGIGMAALGRPGWISLTLSGPRQAEMLERAMAVDIDGAHLFDVVQASWNPLEPSAAPASASAHAEGLGVILK